MTRAKTKHTHKISADFLPDTLELYLTWENLDTGGKASLFTNVTEEVGHQIAITVPPCGYHQAQIADVPAMQIRITELDGVVVIYKARIDLLQQERAGLRAENAKLKDQVSDLMDRVNELDDQVSEQKDQIIELEDRP